MTSNAGLVSLSPASNSISSLAHLIRPFIPSDLSEVKNCNERNLPENYSVNDWKDVSIMFNKTIWVIPSKTGRIVGYIVCTYDYIFSFAVDKQFRGMGLGKKLLETALSCPLIKRPFSLHVKVQNTAARKLYESYGFQNVDFIDAYYKDGSCAIRMQKN